MSKLINSSFNFFFAQANRNPSYCSWRWFPDIYMTGFLLSSALMPMDEDTCKQWCLDTPDCKSIGLVETDHMQCTMFNAPVTDAPHATSTFVNSYEHACYDTGGYLSYRRRSVKYALTYFHLHIFTINVILS